MIGPVALPLRVPTPVVMVKDPVKVDGVTQPAMWRVTLPTAALPGYTASIAPYTKLQPFPPTTSDPVTVNDELARSARPGLATVTVTPVLKPLPPGPEATDTRTYDPLGTVVVFQL